MRADPSPAPPLAGSGDPHNAFTVDLEEWFHVCGVEPLRFEQWATLPSRVEPTTRWLLDALDRADVRATFFVVGWVAERFPRLVEAVRDAGHEIGSHGHAHRRVYELDGEAFRRDLRASVQALKAAGVDGCVVVQGARMVRERPFALGARRARRGGLSSRREHGSVGDGRIAELSAASARAADRRGADRRGAAARGRSVRTGDAPRLGLGTAHELATPGARRDRTAEPSRPARGAHGAPVGNRSGARHACACLPASTSPTTSASADSPTGSAPSFPAAPSVPLDELCRLRRPARDPPARRPARADGRDERARGLGARPAGASRREPVPARIAIEAGAGHDGGPDARSGGSVTLQSRRPRRGVRPRDRRQGSMSR